MGISSKNDALESDDSNSLIYQVRLYLISHSQLQIEVLNRISQQRQYLNFTSVVFFDGPFAWSGSALSLADENDCLKVLKKIGSFNDEDEQILKDEFLMYEMESNEGYIIRIIAGNRPTLTDKNLFSAYVP